MDTRIRSWAGCPRPSCAHVETDWWQACRGWARSWLVRWWSNAANAARRAAGAHKASCTGRMCICRLGAGWSTCRRRWPRWWSPRWPEGSCPCPGCLANPPWWPRRQAPSRRAGWVAMMRGEHKVHALHLERAAIVYVRQSTLVQVREHTESTARQYGLVDQAARLGWPASGIEVIDQDLGLSGRTAAHRDGFKQLMGRVCLGEVGAIFGLEVSRLARSSADLARLLEL